MDTCPHGYLRPTCPSCGHNRTPKMHERFAPDVEDGGFEPWQPGKTFDINLGDIADRVYRSGVDASIRDGNLLRRRSDD